MSEEYISSTRATIFWTEERTLKLRELWGQYISQTEMGRQLGCSKNAVQGKANRLKLKHREAVRSEQQVYELPPSYKSQIKFGPRPLPIAKVEGQVVDFISHPPKLSKECCRWVFSLKPTRYCDEPSLFNKSYCPVHHAIAVRLIAVRLVPKRVRTKHYAEIPWTAFG
jgi:hypothetical protein